MSTTTTTIRVEQTTKKRFAKHGSYGDTVDIILNRILDKAEQEVAHKKK